MSTRGLVGFYKGGVTKAMYNHSDSYISGLGKDAIDFLQKINLDKLPEIFDGIEMIDEKSKPTDKQIFKCQCEGLINLNVSDKSELVLLTKTHSRKLIYLC